MYFGGQAGLQDAGGHNNSTGSFDTDGVQVQTGICGVGVRGERDVRGERFDGKIILENDIAFIQDGLGEISRDGIVYIRSFIVHKVSPLLIQADHLTADKLKPGAVHGAVIGFDRGDRCRSGYGFGSCGRCRSSCGFNSRFRGRFRCGSGFSCGGRDGAEPLSIEIHIAGADILLMGRIPGAGAIGFGVPAVEGIGTVGRLGINDLVGFAFLLFEFFGGEGISRARPVTPPVAAIGVIGDGIGSGCSFGGGSFCAGGGTEPGAENNQNERCEERCEKHTKAKKFVAFIKIHG
nr:MAG TPA: hypothetical protein [Caudoviricetes sp.]